MAATVDMAKHIAKYDKSKMLELIESFPAQVADAKVKGEAFSLPKGFKTSYKNIVATGLGGSAIGADLVRSYVAGDILVPFFVNRNYTLPRFVNEETLVIVSSYSGNTEETLSAYRDARIKKAAIVVITSGGTLEKLAKTNNAPCIIIPKGFPPRCALAYSFFPPLILLSRLGLVRDQSKTIDSTVRILEELRATRIGKEVPSAKNSAKGIAQSLYRKYPVIYGSQDHMDAVVTRWRGQLAENSKTLSSGHVLPEMNHNEIVGWENPKEIIKNCVAVFLRDALDNPRVVQRMDITRRIFKNEKIETIEVRSIGTELLARMFSLVYIGDYVSFYLALLNGIDPTPVERITYLKKELARA